MRFFIRQFIRHNADHFAAMIQAGFLGDSVSPPGITGYQRIALLCSLHTCLICKRAVIRQNIPAANQCDFPGCQQG